MIVKPVEPAFTHRECASTLRRVSPWVQMPQMPQMPHMPYAPRALTQALPSKKEYVSPPWQIGGASGLMQGERLIPGPTIPGGLAGYLGRRIRYFSSCSCAGTLDRSIFKRPLQQVWEVLWWHVDDGKATTHLVVGFSSTANSSA